MNQANWNRRVEEYVQRLAEVNETIDLILDDTRVGTLNVRPEEVEASREALVEAIGRLEAMLPEREDLLRDDDAPKTGITLREKLLSTRRIDDAALARRCDEVSAQIELTRERAISLFVCHFHLAALGQDLIDLLSGQAGPTTYGKQIGQPGNRQRESGGGLFNEAA